MQRGNGIWLALALLWVLPFGVIAQDTLEQVRFDVDRFEVIGDNPIGDSANEILSPYIGEQYGLVRLSAARDALEQAIIDAGFAFHRVSLPPQNLFAGTVQFKISRFLIGKIDVEGNEYFDDENILHSVPQLQVGETPNTRLLSRSLKIANEHASKSTVLRFREGSEADSIDAQLEVKDRDPQVIFLSLDNTGPDDGEVWRSTLGYQHGNLFNTDQSVTATYTTAPEDTSSTQQFGIFYHIPMYRHGASIDLLFSDSDSSGETGGGDDGGQSISPGVGGGQALEITGEGRVYGVVYNRPLLTDSSYNHSLLVGVQHKNFDNTSEFDSVELTGDKKERVLLIRKAIEELKDLKWRYEEGPSGRGRAKLGFTNSTGCSSVWGSSYPYNPYPFPWVNHLFQDAPSVAVGIFEGHMRKMSDGFISVRRAEKLLSDSYESTEDEKFFDDFEWQQFTDDEFTLCPPLFAVGGDGAMMDIGFQNLSRVMATNKPIRVVVVDTQVYSNTGGQACTSGFTSQVSDMAEYGMEHHGKEEVRKELALIAIAHRGVFVMQSSQATPSHLIQNVLKGLQARRPALFILNTPCPPEWGIADFGAPDAARLALESRAVPNIVFDPDEGITFSECIDLEGNPSPLDTWTTYDLAFLDEEGEEQKLNLPVTTADWVGEARFRKHFTKANGEEELVAFHEYVDMDEDEREDGTAFIYTVDANRHLSKMTVSDEIVGLAVERLGYWAQLKEIAGLDVSENMRDTVAESMTEELEARITALTAEYEAKIAKLTTQYPLLIARRMAEGLLKGNANETVSTLLEKAESWNGPAFETPADFSIAAPTAPAATAAPAAAAQAAPAAVAAVAPVAQAEEDMGNEPYIDTLRCTSCDDCLKINPKVFIYNDEQQAEIGDAKAGTFKQLVMAAEACPAECIHPGDPLNPKEKNLDKLIKRAEPFN